MFFGEIRLDILIIFWYFFCILYKKTNKIFSNIHLSFFKNHDITDKYDIMNPCSKFEVILM